MGFAERNGFGFVGISPVLEILTLFECFYRTKWCEGHSCNGDNWKAQTFTPQISHKIAQVVLIDAYKEPNGTSGEIRVSIRAVDANRKPTGSDLTSADVDIADWATSVGSDVIISIPRYSLSASTEYAIVIRKISGPGAAYLSICGYAGYPRGFAWQSSDAGDTWTAPKVSIPTWPYTTRGDFTFEEWGY